LQGRYLRANFWFEAVGRFAIDADGWENPERRESLASLLRKRVWELAPEGRRDYGST
jgi:hypothetical protein